MTKGLARRTDPATSHAAADAIETTQAEDAVVAYVRRYPSTAEEVALGTGISQQTITPRFRPLANKGIIYDTKERRLNLSGRSAIVWAFGKGPPVVLRRTRRGFIVYDIFSDVYKNKIRVQESAVVPGAVWIVREADSVGVHLNTQMARRLIRSLQTFVKGKRE